MKHEFHVGQRVRYRRPAHNETRGTIVDIGPVPNSWRVEWDRFRGPQRPPPFYSEELEPLTALDQIAEAL